MYNSHITRITVAVLAVLCLLAAPGVALAEDTSPIFDVPRFEHIVVDGQAGDWHDQGFVIETMTSANGLVKPAADMDSHLRLGWDDRGLLVLIQVSDQSFVESQQTDRLYVGDSVELFLADKRGGSQLIQAVISPGMTAEQPDLRYYLYDYRQDPALKAIPLAISAARTRVTGGDVLEVLIPWSNIGVKPEIGSEVAFQVFANDRDDGAPLFRTVWYPATSTFQNTNRAHRIRLAQRASPPCSAVARGFSRLNHAWFTVVAVPRLAGKTVTVRYQGNIIAEGTTSKFGERAFACVHASLPPGVVETSRFDVMLDGQVVDAVGLLDLEGEYGEGQLPLKYAFHPYVFSGKKLPPGGFEDPGDIARRLGPCKVKVTYYNAALEIVTNAAKPGRYSAIVEVTPRFHPPVWRYYTLYRTAAPVDWGAKDLAGNPNLPAKLGLDAQVVSQHEVSAGYFARTVQGTAFPGSTYNAAYLAWLQEMPRGTPDTQRFGMQSAISRWRHDLKRRAGMLAPLKYWVDLPRDVAKDPARKWPAILYLHGSGDCGEPVGALAGTAAVRLPRELRPDTFIVIAPRCPLNTWWSQPDIEDLIAEVQARYPIDPDRFYLTGVSMGGFATWALLAERPDLFAAAVPLCGGGDPAEADRLKDVPIWVFQGAKDSSVPPAVSRRMVDALRQRNGRVRYTEYPDLGHVIWYTAYNTPELYDWMLQQVRGHPQEPRTETPREGSGNDAQ